MLRLICTILFAHVAVQARLVVTDDGTVVDNGQQKLECKQEPLELGIVLDSSSSISAVDFKKGIRFLQGFVGHYEIGTGRNDVRVSIITFGRGIYPELGFNLTTHTSKEEVVKALDKVPHKFGLYTSTGKAIEYMSQFQLSSHVTRPWADRICIVITDGNSQRWRQTRDAAQAARDSGILIFAIGVGAVRDRELLNIAGDESRVVKVDNYDQLKQVQTGLAYKTCLKKEQTTRSSGSTSDPTALPLTQKCGRQHPADIYFVFSPAALGMEITSWTTSFISKTVRQEELNEGFRFGVVSGSCPDDEGFDLKTYSTRDGIETRLTNYQKPRMPTLVDRLATSGYNKTSGGRPEARDVAVIVADGGKKNKGLEAEVLRLQEMGVQVFIADPLGSGVAIDGAITLSGRSARTVAANLVTHLCPVRTGEA